MNFDSIYFNEYILFSANLHEKIDIIKSQINISTLNAHSYNLAQSNTVFKTALQASDILLPDGVSIVLATRFLTGKRIKKIAGEDIFYHLVNELNKKSGKCFFLGSSDETLAKIKNRLSIEYPNIKAEFYSPPFKSEFDDEDNRIMLQKINDFQPHVLFVGMTAPKQEIWVHQHKDQIKANIKCSIGAVFDFYAGTVKRAPQWIIKLGLEWLFRLVKEPKRMWKRYLIGNTKFIWYVGREKIRRIKR